MLPVLPGLRLAIARLNMRSFYAAAYLLACSSAAFGQQITILVDNTPQVTDGRNDCNTVHRVNWTLTGLSAHVCSGPTFWITFGTNCGDAPAGNDIPLTPSPQPTDTQGNFTTRPIGDFPGFSQADGGPGCPASVNLTHSVCGSVTYTTFTCGSGNVVLHAAAPGTINYRGNPPNPPDTPTLVAQDSALTAQWSTSPTDAVYIHAYSRVAGSGAVPDNVRTPATNSSIKIGNLQNGTTYEVWLTAEDAAGQESAPSGTALGTPVASYGFYATYRNEGGQDQGGCGGAIPGVVGVPLALGSYHLLRRKRSCRRDS
jgi:hypothetical protein